MDVWNYVATQKTQRVHTKTPTDFRQDIGSFGTILTLWQMLVFGLFFFWSPDNDIIYGQITSNVRMTKPDDVGRAVAESYINKQAASPVRQIRSGTPTRRRSWTSAVKALETSRQNGLQNWKLNLQWILSTLI